MVFDGIWKVFILFVKKNSKEHYKIDFPSSLNYNIKADRWRKIADYDVERVLAAYTVLEGKVFCY